MADKTWTATDLSKGKITIEKVGVQIKFGFRYNFKDANGDIISELPTRSLTETITISSLPTSIVSALLGIQTYLYNAALTKEGMN